jgi:hypothetical protein
MISFTQDIRYAVRGVLRNPLHAASSILLIAVSIGLACSAFAIVDAISLQDLPATRLPLGSESPLALSRFLLSA